MTARFTRAGTYWRRNHYDEADRDLIAVFTRHADADVAPQAATMLLDGLNVRHRYDEMLRWVVQMRADPVLTREPQLAEQLLQLEVAFLRHEAESAEAAHAFARCTELYDRAYALAPKSTSADELLYNSSVCAEAGGDASGAIARGRELVHVAGTSRLASHMLGRLAALHAAIGDYAASAVDDEQLAFRGEPHEARDAIGDAVRLRTLVGDDAIAERDLAHATHVLAEDAWTALAVTIARIRLDRGDRGGARRVLDLALARPRLHVDVATLAWDLACPTIPTDGLCLVHDVPMAREHRYAELALSTVRRSAPQDDHLLIAAEAALELALADHTPAHAAAATTALAPLVRSPDPAIELVAHVQLARLAHHAGDVTAEHAELTACRDRALHELSASWLATCESRLGLVMSHDVMPPRRAGPIAVDSEEAFGAP